MVKLEGKKKSLSLFFVFFYLPSIALLLLVGSSNLAQYITTTFYIILGLGCLVVLGTMLKSDDKYYRNFGFTNLIAAIFVGLVMTVFSWGLSLSLQNSRMLMSVNSLSLLPMPTSISMMFLSAVVSGLVLAATSEELFKLGAFAEAKERWGKNGYKLGAITVPGVLIYVGFPVGFWALLHGVQAYSDPVMIIPAFVNGVLLIIYLWKTECILGCIFAHWIYNGGITLILYLKGQAGVPVGTPLFPDVFSPTYFSNSGFIFDILLVLLGFGILFLFLIPSLKKESR
jgi:hypothetical protein